MGVTTSTNSAVTYEVINTYTFDGTQSSVTFNNISQAYTDLVVVSQWKQAPGNTANYALRINGSSDYTKYYTVWLDGAGGAASGGSQPGNNSSYNFMRLTSYGYVSSTWGTYITQFNSYSNTNVNKSVMHRGGNSNNNVGTNLVAGLYTSTAAITSLTFFAQGGAGGNMASGSTTTVYGIKAA